MAIASFDAELFTATAPGPYIARSASDRTDDWFFWYVAGPDGKRNVLSGPEGSVLTDRETAIALAARWNGQNAPERRA